MKLHNILLVILASANINAEESSPKVTLTAEQISIIKKQAELEVVEESNIDANVIIKNNQQLDDIDRSNSYILEPPKLEPIKKITISTMATELKSQPTINVYPNQITVFTFTDSMGQAWPLRSTPIVGAKKHYIVHYQENIPGVVTIETTSRYVPTSMAVLLEDRVQPVQFQLRNNGHKLNGDVRVKVIGRSRLNKSTTETETYNIPTLNNSDASAFLMDPPNEAKRIRVLGDKATKVWSWQNKCYVKTPYHITNPQRPEDIQSLPDAKNRIYVYTRLPGAIAAFDDRTGDVKSIRIVGGCL